MYDTTIIVAGILGVSLILSVTVYISGHLRIEQQRTLQKLLDSGGSVDHLAGAEAFRRRAERDLRRGILLVGVGVSWSLVTFFIGGHAWILGVVPVVLGLVYILFWKRDDTRH